MSGGEVRMELFKVPSSSVADNGSQPSDSFVDDVNDFLTRAGLETQELRLVVGPDGYEVYEGTSLPQKFTDVSETINAINLLVAKRDVDRQYPLFRAYPFWDQPAWLVDIDGQTENIGPEAESLLLTSTHNNDTWTFDYEDPAFQESAAREAQKIIDQCTFLLGLPKETLNQVATDVAPGQSYPLRERLVEYREALLQALKDVPRNIADIHERVAFSTAAKPDSDIEPLKLSIRLSYRYRHLGIFNPDLSPDNFASLYFTRALRTDDARALSVGEVTLHHPASFALALDPDDKDSAEVSWNLQLLSNWLRFLAQRGFEVGLVNDQIVVRLNQAPVMKFFLRDQLLVEQWMEPQSTEWQEAVVGKQYTATALVTHNGKHPWSLATFKLPNGKRLPPMKFLSMIPQMGSRDKHPTNLERQATENLARWMGSLMVNLADWRSMVPEREGSDKKKREDTSDVATLPTGANATTLFAQQLEDHTRHWIQKLLEDLQWGGIEVAVLFSQQKNLAEGLRHLLGRKPTPSELANMTTSDMGGGVAGRWGIFSTNKGTKKILWLTGPESAAHEAGHDFFHTAGRSVEVLVENQWHTTGLLFPREEDFLGYAQLVQDYFATMRDFDRGGSGNLPTHRGSLTDIGSGNLAAVITSMHGGLGYVFPSAYALWGDIDPFSKNPDLAGQEYAAELWEQEMHKFTLAGAVFHATDPHEEGEVNRHLSFAHQATIQVPFRGAPDNPFVRDAMLRHQVPLDELHLYQTRTEVLRSDDAKIARRQRLQAIAHYAPDVLRNGLKKVKAVRLASPHERTLVPVDDAVLHVDTFLRTPEQERLGRAQAYNQVYRSVDLAEGEVVAAAEPHRSDGSRVERDFNDGQVMQHADMVGGDVSVDTAPVEPPKQQVVSDNRPEMPEQWFPFEHEQQAVAWKKENESLDPEAVKDAMKPLAEPGAKPLKGEPETVPASYRAQEPQPQREPEQPQEESGFKWWMVPLAPLAPLYPAYKAIVDARRREADVESVSEAGISEHVVPRMAVSAMLCIDPARANGKFFAMSEDVYQSYLPMLTEYELYHRFDPEMAYDIFVRLRDLGVDPDYLLNCFTFPLVDALTAHGEYKHAFELNAWAQRTDQLGEHADAIRDGFIDITNRIFENRNDALFSLGWDALERALGFEPRTPEMVRLAAHYLIWRDGAALEPSALFDFVVGLTAGERKVAADASIEWIADADSDLAVDVSALRNAWVWLGDRDAFVHDILERYRKGFINGYLLDKFIQSLPSPDADELARLWFGKGSKEREFALGFSWLEQFSFASLETVAAALMRGSEFDGYRRRIAQFVSNLSPERREDLVSALQAKIDWNKDEKNSSFQAARSLALYFPDPIEGIDALIDGFLKNAWPNEKHVEGTDVVAYQTFLDALGIRSWNDLPSMQNYARTLIDRTLEQEGFPVNAQRLFEFYAYLYEFYRPYSSPDGFARLPNRGGAAGYLYFLNYALTALSSEENEIRNLPELPTIMSNYYDNDLWRPTHRSIVTVTMVRLRMCQLISKLDRRSAERIARNTPPSFEASDRDRQDSFVLNAVHEPWDENFPRTLLERRTLYMMGVVSDRLQAIVRDSRFSKEMRMKAALMLVKLNRVTNLDAFLTEAGLADVVESSEWKQWSTLLGTNND